MYNVVDSFYAGEISTAALAALGLSFPVFLLIIATSGGLSRGASALIANAIGAQEEDKQRRYIAQSISLGLVVSMVMTVTGIVVAKPLFQLLGGTGGMPVHGHGLYDPNFYWFRFLYYYKPE